MAIMKNKPDEQPRMSQSTKVGKANSKEIKKRSKAQTMDGVALQLGADGKVVAPKAKAKPKKDKTIADMVKNAKQ